MDAPELIGGNNGPATPAALLDEGELFAAALIDVCILFTAGTCARSIARRIHGLRGGLQGPFVAVDCGGPERVLERQVFDVLWPDDPDRGEPRRAFPMAGTLFLEEVGKLSLEQQGRLLDALTDPSRQRGPRRMRPRVMASSSEPLLARVLAGTFNDRLFYRLNAVHLVLPPHEGAPEPRPG